MSQHSDVDVIALLDHLGVRKACREVLPSWRTTNSVEARYEALTSHQRRFLAAVPFDDLDLHNSTERVASLVLLHA